jgi:hypothetical protein
MKIFHCDHCDQLIFFENTFCVSCGHTLAYLPDEADMGTFKLDGDHPRRVGVRAGQELEYRFCANYTPANVCNWVVSTDDPNPYCQSCRLTRIIPNLSQAGTREEWSRLEAAKRRLMYSLISLNLPAASKAEDPERGLGFEFLADQPPGTPGAAKVLTGHENGMITINVAEADGAERERRRLQMHEPYRTILGHFRHEIGHYYWDRLIRDSAEIEDYRRLFGDERQDYAQALQSYHKQGAPPDWPLSFVSAYASAHPWEDWAETWAHYLHIIDTLETAVECGLTLRPKRSDEPALKPNISVVGRERPTFDKIIDRWFPLTYVLNNLNRGMGLQDAYPFILPPPVLDKLRFIHELIGKAQHAKERPKAAIAS